MLAGCFYRKMLLTASAADWSSACRSLLLTFLPAHCMACHVADCPTHTAPFPTPRFLLPADWQQLHGAASGGRAMRALLAAGEASAMHVVVENRLGVEAAMELDFGDHL